MKKWNNVYKRWECKFCDEPVALTERHICAKSKPAIYDLYWQGITPERKNNIRREFNQSKDYEKYASVAEYAYINKY